MYSIALLRSLRSYVTCSSLQTTGSARGILKIRLPCQASQDFVGIIRCGGRDTVTSDECVLFRGYFL